MEPRARRTRSSSVTEQDAPLPARRPPARASRKPVVSRAFVAQPEVIESSSVAPEPVSEAPETAIDVPIVVAPSKPVSPVKLVISHSTTSVQVVKKHSRPKSETILPILILAAVAFIVLPWLLNILNVVVREVLRPALTADELAETASVAASLPKEVYMKTLTESLTHNHYVAIRKGRAYFKVRESAEQVSGDQWNEWQLLGSDGLPHPGWFYYYWPTTWVPTNFVKPNKVVAVSADDDNLNLIGDNSVVYYLKWHSMKWQGHWGLEMTIGNGYLGPADFPVLPMNRGFAASNRGSFAGIYTDPCGHTFEMTIGVDSMFMLTPDGTELHYIDPWVPPTFHQRIAMPEKNVFIAQAMSAAGSVIMLIDNAGMSNMSTTTLSLSHVKLTLC
eukprot:TRINITY_DN6772_c0_g1_i2.p1 TRINITY_DN6772_c0_g1~~TRINITY_DN6772_c0_g1_i2.p1  ORF type:complete len:397 (+),score=69.52 TRINITY_DN6772_c0_g1_i2:26-1192(+)